MTTIQRRRMTLQIFCVCVIQGDVRAPDGRVLIWRIAADGEVEVRRRLLCESAVPAQQPVGRLMSMAPREIAAMDSGLSGDIRSRSRLGNGERPIHPPTRLPFATRRRRLLISFMHSDVDDLRHLLDTIVISTEVDDIPVLSNRRVRQHH